MDFAVPELDAGGEMSGGSVAEAEVARWLVEDGALVARGQEVLELSLDKANQTVEAPAAGTLRQIAREGDVVAPGDVVATID